MTQIGVAADQTAVADDRRAGDPHPLAELDPQLPEEIAHQSPIARAWRAFEHAVDDKIKQAAIAA